MPETSPVTAQVAPVKPGKSTSTFLITLAGIAATSLPGLLQYLIAFAERNADQIPANSWLSFALPVLIAIGYQVTRMLTMNGERNATAKVAQAQAVVAVAQAQAPSTKDIVKTAGESLLLDLLKNELDKRASSVTGVFLGGGKLNSVSGFAEPLPPQRIADAPVASDADFSDVDANGVQFPDEDEPQIRGTINNGTVTL